MTPNQIAHELLKPTELRSWFYETAHKYAEARGTDGQELATSSFDKAIDALTRRSADIHPPKAWLRTVIHNAWRDQKRAYAREQRSESLADVYEDPRSPYVLTPDDKAAIASDLAERKSERERQELEWATRELRPRDGQPVAVPPVVSRLSEEELQRQADEKRAHEERERKRLAWINP